MKAINIMESGRLIDYEEYEKLSDEEQEHYYVSDDFCDCDKLAIDGKEIVEFFHTEKGIFYRIIEYDYEMFEDTIQQILEEFFTDDFEKSFYELDTAHLSPEEQKEYDNIINSNITLAYRGGVGYYYAIYKLTNDKLINKLKEFEE